MLKIRLRRVGAKKKPQYRVVVAEAQAPRDGAFVEIIGHYNPLTDPSTVTIDREKALKWLSNGAQPTGRAAKLLNIAGVEYRQAKPKQGEEGTS
ncbi:MAG: 30S ribosomal protein S16 [Chloroflexi bacterium]|nr:30S ribosomal protein S16 [Chloroflexota bacterium]